MDLVKIGFLIQTSGLEKANKEVDSLLDKTSKIGTVSKKAAADAETSQNKVKKATEGSTKAADNNTKAVEKTTKALEKQKIIGDYLGKGLDKTTATTVANFKQLGASVSETSTMLNTLANNKGILQTRKDIEAANKAQQEHAKLVEQTIGKYRQLSSKSLGGGILDTIEQENKGLQELRKHYSSLEKQQEKNLSVVKEYEAASRKSFGGGILDTIGKQDKGLQDLNAEYRAMEVAQSKLLNAEKQANVERQKTVALEQAKAKYIKEGFGKGSATQLAKMELSGADQTTLDNYKASLLATSSALGSFAGSAKKATEEKSKFLDQVKGIAVYAALSAAIYGVMTAMTNLAVATVRMADEYTAIQNRMKLYIKDAEELGQVNAKLAQYAMENNVGLRETATLFARLAPSMQRIGANTAAVTSVVDAFGKSMRIGGATAMEAASATIQFSQAMASGKLAGDEFRSISEASPRFLKAIADGSGIAASKLKEMSSAGLLTTEVISKALLKEYPKLIAENAQLGATLEQGTNAMKTAFTVMVGEFNEGAKATETIGTAMMGLASSMIKTAQSARQTGEDMRNWFADNANNINLLVNAFKVLTAIIASRYVAAIILARVESIRYQATLLSMVAAQTQATRTSTLLAAALSGVGAAAKGALAFFGGWVGLGLTVATAAASYFLLRDNTDAATIALAAQEGVVTKTTQELLKLSGAQKELEKQRMSEQFDVQKKGLEQVEQQIQAVIIAERARANFSDEMTTLLRGVKDGTISYSDALEQLNKQKGVNPKNIGTLETLIKQYNELAPKALQLAEGQRVLGIDVDDVGNAAQNTTPEVRNLVNGYSDLEKAAFSASNRISALGKDIRNQIYQLRIARKLQQEEGLSSSSANMLAKSLIDQGQIVRSSGKVRDALDAENKLRAAIERDKKKGFDTTESELRLSKLVVQNQKTIANNLREYQKSHAGLLRQLDAENELGKEYNDTLKERDGDKEADRLKDIRQGYQDQIDEVIRLNNLISQGVDYEAAKIAAAKDYAEAIGDASVAQQVVAYQQLTQRLAYEASLAKEVELQSRVVKLMAIGATYSQARTIAEAKFTDDLRGRQALEDTILNEMVNKQYSLADQLSTQKSINYFLERGLSLEEATTKAAFGRLSAVRNGLTEQQKGLRDQTISQEYSIRLETSRAKILQDLTALARESVELAYLQNNELAEIAKSYDKIDVNSVRELSTRQKIVDKMKEYNDQLAYDKANPLGDFRDINFEAFGDFGNPFKSALDGLNAMVGGVKVLDNEYKTMFASLSDQWNKADVGSKERAGIEAQQAALAIQWQEEKAKANHKAISSGLSLTKSLFKEESKGYKVVSGLEKAYQASVIAFKLWEKKDEIAFLALKLKAHVTDALGFTTGAAAKLAAQSAVNVAKGTEAVLTQGSGDPYTAFPRMAAMAALVAGLGVAIGSVSGGSSGSFAPTNEGTGTVFGDSSAQSESIKKSIDTLAENSDVTTPLTAAMLKSLQNIENSIGGLSNLIIRRGIGESFSVTEYDGVLSGVIGVADNLFVKFTNGLEKVLTGGLLSKFGLGGLGTSLISSAVSKLFGKTVSVKGQGLYGGNQQLSDVLSGGFNLQEYVDIQTKKKTLGITTSKTNSTNYKAASQELENQFTLIFKGFNDAILSAAPILDRNTNEVLQKLDNFIINIGKINLHGLKGEEIQEKLNAVFGAEADKMAQAALGGLDDFQKVGEGYFETLMRVATSIEMASVYTDRLNVSAIKYTDILNKQGDVTAEIIRQSVLLNEGNKDIQNGFYDLVNAFDGTASEITDFVLTLRELQDALVATGKNGDYLTSAMFAGAGSLDRLQDGLEAYFEMLTPAEQAAELVRRMTREFAAFGEELPSSVETYRQLVSAIDITTEAGQKLYGQVIALAPEFTDLQDALKKADDAAKAQAEEARRAAEEAARAAEAAKKAAEDLAKLRTAFFITGQHVSRLTQVMINAAGGVEAMQRGLDAMFEMLSPTEKAAELTRRLAIQFKALGLELPSSTDAFRALVKGMDTSRNSGKALLGKVIALAPEFNELQKALESANGEVNQLVQSLRDLAEQARQARGETEQPRNLDYARAMFESTAMLAMQGDTQAAEKLMSLGTNLMELSKQYSVDGSEYARDLAWIQRAATISADVQEGGLGYVSPTLSTTLSTSLSGGNTTPTLATTSTSTDAEIKELRGDINAALLAIAKYTQTTANKLENWDDGNRVMVGVMQEAGDPKVPVTIA